MLYRPQYKPVTGCNYNPGNCLFSFKGFFLFFFYNFASIVNVLYDIWQDGCWWDTNINKGNFVSY